MSASEGDVVLDPADLDGVDVEPLDDAQSETDEVVDDPDATDIEENPPTADQSLRYFGADFDVEGLVRRLRAKDLTVPSFDPEGASGSDYEGFQRRFVWPKKQMDRFVESLLLGYPVPGIFLVELSSRKYLVLDGQQRLRTLRAFYDGQYGKQGHEKVFRLTYVAKDFYGKTISSLSPADKRLLDNTFIQATIVVPKEGSDKSAVYRLFERINSSGIKLQPQEIRVALYSGPMIRLIRDLNQNQDWRALFGEPHSRLKDHELILRYMALKEMAKSVQAYDWDRDRAREAGALYYRPAMTTFLNSYLDRHANLVDVDAEKVKAEFGAVVGLLREGPGRSALRITGTQVNAAHTDAILVGLALALEDGLELSSDDCVAAISRLESDDDYREVVSGSTSHSDSVIRRISLAVAAFASQS